MGLNENDASRLEQIVEGYEQVVKHVRDAIAQVRGIEKNAIMQFKEGQQIWDVDTGPGVVLSIKKRGWRVGVSVRFEIGCTKSFVSAISLSRGRKFINNNHEVYELDKKICGEIKEYLEEFRSDPQVLVGFIMKGINWDDIMAFSLETSDVERLAENYNEVEFQRRLVMNLQDVVQDARVKRSLISNLRGVFKQLRQLVLIGECSAIEDVVERIYCDKLHIYSREKTLGVRGKWFMAPKVWRSCCQAFKELAKK